MKIGKAKYGSTKRTFFKIKDGDNVFRILPPLGNLADKGVWSVFYNVHYGYKNSEGKLRPFQSSLVKNRKTKMVETPDAALEKIEKLKAALEGAKKANDTKLVAKLNEFVGPKGAFNLDNNHYVNAIDLQGNIGILKLRHRAKVAMDATIKKLRESGVDPLSVEDGRYFVINRSGNALDTTFQVSVYTEKINIQGVGEVLKEVKHVLDEGTIGRLSQEAADLDKLFKRPTAEQIARIVAEGAVAVDEILDAKASSGGSSEGGEGDYDGVDEEETSSTQAQGASGTGGTSVSANNTVLSGQTTVVGNTALNTQAQTQVQAAPVSTPATTTASQVNEMSDDEFLKSLNL